MTWVLTAVTVLLGVTTRVVGLDDVPPGLYHDEAINGLDALRVLGGERPIFFEANNGREPLFIYAMAVAMGLLGRTPTAVRLAAAVLGALTVPATFWMARAMFDERVGLWSAFWMAISPWPINLSRIGLRAVSMPLIVALGVGAWWTGRRQHVGRQRAKIVVTWVALGGALLGLSLYTYTAARFVLPAIVLFVLYQACTYKRRYIARIELLVLFLAAALAMAPLAAYAVANWDTFAERSAQVSVFNPAIGGDRPWKLLAGNVFRAAGLFAVRGDRIPRHNVPFRPLYDPLSAVFCALGALSCLGTVTLPGRVGRKRDETERSGACALALIWTGVMLAPTILAEDCPHFLRAVGVLPMAAVYPALGLEWVRRRLRFLGERWAWAGPVVTALVLCIAAAWGLYDYFWQHGRDPELGYAFEASQVREAVEINRYLGTGWQGQGASEPVGSAADMPIEGRRVYLSPRMWEDRFSVNLLVGSPERLSILGGHGAQEQPAEALAPDEVLVLAWPYGDLRQAQEVLPHPAEIAIWPGPWERGDLDPEPRLLYVAYRAARLAASAPTVARFEEGIELLGWATEPAGETGTRLRLRWRATMPLSTDYNVFVHVVRGASESGVASEGDPAEGRRTVAQDDGTPGTGYYATSLWRPEDEILDEHVMDVSYDPRRDQIVVGWYEWSSMRHLQLIWGENGEPGADRYVLRSSTG